MKTWLPLVGICALWVVSALLAACQNDFANTKFVKMPIVDGRYQMEGKSWMDAGENDVNVVIDRSNKLVIREYDLEIVTFPYKGDLVTWPVSDVSYTIDGDTVTLQTPQYEVSTTEAVFGEEHILEKWKITRQWYPEESYLPL